MVKTQIKLQERINLSKTVKIAEPLGSVTSHKPVGIDGSMAGRDNVRRIAGYTLSHGTWMVRAWNKPSNTTIFRQLLSSDPSSDVFFRLSASLTKRRMEFLDLRVISNHRRRKQ